MSTDLEPIDYDQSGSRADYLVRDDNALSATLFGTDNPAEVVARAAVVATALADLVHKQNLVVRIGQSEHVRVEGWTLLGSMLGVFPVVTWTRPILVEHDQPGLGYVGWEARVEARTRAGEVVGAAESECLRSERTWATRDDYALRSMAQTRAVSKALRLPLGFVMQLAGFNPTPAEEMPTIDMADPSIPFGDSPVGTQPPASKAQKKKLDVLVGKLRPGRISTEWLWARIPRPPVLSDDGVLHWSPLRESLTKVEASKLIETLEALSSSVEPQAELTGTASPGSAGTVSQPVSGEAGSTDEILRLSALIIGGSRIPSETAAAIEHHAAANTPVEHWAWLERFAADHGLVDAARDGDAT